MNGSYHDLLIENIGLSSSNKIIHEVTSSIIPLRETLARSELVLEIEAFKEQYRS